MAIRHFSVGPLKGLVHAEANDLGNLVVIAGPNGAGKSSLLDSLRASRHTLAEPGTEVLFMGPHRTWRSAVASMVSVYGYSIESFSEVLKLDQLPSSQFGMGVLQFLANMPRDSGSADDSQAFVKTSLIRLHNKQQALVTRAFNSQNGEVAAGSVPQMFEPFARLVDTLLPHLRWLRVDDSSPTDIRCVFELKDRPGTEFDIDALSSGEKAVVSMFLPFVEHQADQLVNPSPVAPGVVPITMILDEPEIHLHPSLQLQVLQYLRDLGKEDAAQFIVSTHSPTLLDALDDDELWLLSPAALRPDNQISRLSTSHERLEVARSITGATHLLTRSTPIVLMEGVTSKATSAGDARLTKILIPEVRSWSLIPSGGKAEVGRSVERLRSSDVDVPGLPVFGLVDGDHGGIPADDHVVEWPVAMIENLLLNGDAIFGVLESLPTGNGGFTAASIDQLIKQIAGSRRLKEIELRVRADLPVGHLRFGLEDVERLDELAKEQVEAWLEAVRAKNPTALMAQATHDVDAIVAEGSEVRRFHGKEMFKELCEQLPIAPLANGTFAALIAAKLAGSPAVQALTSAAIVKIQLYMPDVVPALDSVSPPPYLEVEKIDLIALCRDERARWVAGTPEGSQRISLRERLFTFARQLSQPDRVALAGLASEVGTP